MLRMEYVRHLLDRLLQGVGSACSAVKSVSRYASQRITMRNATVEQRVDVNCGTGSWGFKTIC